MFKLYKAIQLGKYFRLFRLSKEIYKKRAVPLSKRTSESQRLKVRLNKDP